MQASEKHPPAGIEQITLVELLDRDLSTASTGRGAELFGRYRVLGLLGSGGMGAVYRVWDAVLEDEVALKMLRRELLDEPGVLTRFRQEVKLARRISHPNVVRTFDLGEHDGDYYLTMELIRGRSVRRILAEEGQLPLDRALLIARQVAAGISAAHAAGVLHCDLKPENLLLDDQGRVAITDFGVARAMGGGGGLVAGTPGFMAPELVELGTADARTDLYALGVVLFEVVTGRSPWADPELRRDPAARLRVPPPDPRQLARVPEELASVIVRLLSPRPEGRPVAASAVQAELEEIELSAGRRPTPNPVGMVPAPTTPSLAVLPFGNAGSSEDAHLAEGLTEEIIDALSATRGLRVRPLSATLGARAPGGALAAGRALDVQAVVEGTVRRRAGEVVLAVRLIGVSDGFQLWARRFRCQDGDALMVAEEVARAIAEALAAELPGTARAEPGDPVALELYLRARHVLRAGWDLGPGEAVSLLEQALAREPHNADALAVYAMALGRQAFFEQRKGEALRATLERMRQAADEAVKLAPHQGDAWLALANAHLYTGNPAEAARALQESVRRAPGTFRAQQMLGSLALEVGRVELAREHLLAAVAIDPDGIQPRVDLVRLYGLLGQWSLVDEQVETIKPGAKGEDIMALTCARISFWAPGRDFVVPARLEAFTPTTRMVTDFISWFRQARDLGDVPEGALRELEAPPTGDLSLLNAVRRQLLAEVLTVAGAPRLGLRALRQAVDSSLHDLFWMDRCPTLEPLRAEPEWQNLRAIVAGRAATIAAAMERR